MPGADKGISWRGRSDSGWDGRMESVLLSRSMSERACVKTAPPHAWHQALTEVKIKYACSDTFDAEKISDSSGLSPLRCQRLIILGDTRWDPPPREWWKDHPSMQRVVQINVKGQPLNT